MQERQKNMLETKQTNKQTKRDYQRNKIRVFFFTISPVSQATRQKKNMLETNKKKTGLPTKENNNLLLHYQPSFPGERTKKFKKFFIAYTFIPNTSLKRGYYDKSQINLCRALLYFQPVRIIFFNFCIIPVHGF